MAHGVVAAALQNRARGSRCTEVLVFITVWNQSLFIHCFINGEPAFIPDQVVLAAGRTEEEPGSILGVVIKERIHSLDGRLELLVLLSICKNRSREIDVLTRSSRLVVLREHVVAAWSNHMIHIAKQLTELFRSQPVRRILGMVVVVIHENADRFLEVVIASIVVGVFCADVIALDGLHHLSFTLCHYLVGVDAVGLHAGAVCGK